LGQINGVLEKKKHVLENTFNFKGGTGLPDQHHGAFFKLVAFLDHFWAILGTLLNKSS
jgi:hypothetical protein